MKQSIFTIIFSAFSLITFGQQDAFEWRIGAYSGFNIYKGDLNSGINAFDVQQPLNDFPNTDWQDLLAYGVSVEKTFKGFGLKLLATKGVFEANDRAKNYWNNDFLDNPNIERSLNVQTQLYDASILATFYSDNGKILSKKAIISPYFSIGFGVTQFETFGDLFTENNQRYYYWSDGKIYDTPENSLPPNITELRQDGNFETNLTDLQTEGINYNTIVWNIPVAVGLKFRLHERLNLNVEVLGRYVNSDYLDDVSGDYLKVFENSTQEYATNPNTQNTTQRGDNDANDFYGMASLSLHYNFGRKSEDFMPPVFYSAGDGNTKATSNTTINTTINTTTSTTTPSEPIVNVNSNVVLNIDTIGLSEKIVLPKVELEKTDSLKQIATKFDETVENTIIEINEITTKPTVIETPVVKEITKDSIIQVVTKPTTGINLVKSTKPNVTDSLKLNTLEVGTSNKEQQTFLEVQKTRLEVAKLNEQTNVLLKNYDATKKDSLVILNQKMERLDTKLEGFQQYLNQLAIQGNTNYAKLEVQAIKRSNNALITENNALKQKYRVLVLGEEDPDAVKAALAKVEAENTKHQQKIKALENQVSTLEAQKTALQNINVNVQTTTPSSIPQPTKVVTTPIVVPTEKTINRVVIPSQPMVLDMAIVNSLPDSMAKKILVYDADMKKLSAELERLNSSVIPEKDKTIDSLKMKMQYIQGQLDGVKVSNTELAKVFEKRIGALQVKIAKIEKQTTKPQVIEKPIVVEEVIERVVEVPTKNPALVIVENFKKSNVYFDNGSVTIKSEFYNRLDRIGLLMNQYPELVVMLKGYTDKSGNPTTNFRLSKQRAEAVKSYLIRQGIRGDRIDISYYGDNAASAINDPFSRRVEVDLVIGQ
jgi:outer membrane protein OmpA-like peptidoglycan-associated protein